MKTKIAKGTYVTMVAPHAADAGAGVQVGSIFGIAVASAAKGAPVTLDLGRDVFRLPKPAKQAWREGAPVFWDSDTRMCTTAGSGKLRIGAAVWGPSAEVFGAVLIGAVG